ncbi:MAG: nicotinamide mononucleotide transporter [Clostridia bacterium]|nr:nicotinamide mononucleotide transporter [Clostridia bacterium]
MKIKNPFRDLTRFEVGLWLLSVVVIIASYAISRGGDLLTMIASLIGVTALIFVAKGYVLGQMLTVAFAVFYGIISFFFSYYGEMITYLFMTAPIAIVTVIEWIRHPYEGTKEVQVSHLTRTMKIVMVIGAILSTVAFYFILGALGNANLIVSTLSVTTSFVASYLTFCRSPYYALAYAANDIVLIILWVLSTLTSISYLPMVFCFVMFFANDIYGFYNWKRMQKRQGEKG